MTEIASIYDIDTKTLSDDGVWCHLRHPTTDDPLTLKGQPIRIRLSGIDGERWQRAQRKARQRRQDKTTYRANRAIIDPDIEASIEIDTIVEATLSWENITKPDGTPIEFSADAARALYRERRWIFDQVNSFMGDRANFLQAAPIISLVTVAVPPSPTFGSSNSNFPASIPFALPWL